MYIENEWDDDEGRDQGGAEQVGYARPPVHSRWKPGQSGNPAGKAKRKPTTFVGGILAKLDEPMKVTQGGKTKKIPYSVAMVMQLLKDYTSGTPKERREIIRLLDGLGVFQAQKERAEEPEEPQGIYTEEHRRILAEAEAFVQGMEEAEQAERALQEDFDSGFDEK